jgi:hypothetical protein
MSGADLRSTAVWLMCLACALLGPQTSAAANMSRVTDWTAAASHDLDPRALATLKRITDPPRQLLALRGYLRAGDSLPQRWSWSPQQLAAYPSTAEGRAAAADVDAVEQAFARADPGYTARANRMPRSLDLQIEHWNANSGVAIVADQLVRALQRQFAATTPSGGQLRQALMDWHPAIAAPLAPPGLSAHGQGRAFDFDIEHDGAVVAGFDAAAAHSQWDRQGWTEKLHAAVIASGKPFAGPLASPYEPWHYAYAPIP